MKLELKIPPVAVVLILMALMLLPALILPGFLWSMTLKVALLAIFGLAGLFCALLGVVSCARAETTVNPLAPETASALVTGGIYRFTRNPMYLGLMVFLIGWGLFLASPLAVLLAFLFVPYMNHFQIRPEEQALRRLFGPDYEKYCAEVRRWL